MALMTFDSLIAPKGTAGSIMSWVNYTKVSGDMETVVAEAESLIYTALRVRQMRSEWTFGMAVGQSEVPLPDRYLDPIGRLFDITNNMNYGHSIETDVAEYRSYQPMNGTMGNNPFTTVVGSSLVTVQKAAHNLTQGSTAYYAGSAVVGGANLNRSFPVVSIIDANNYVIDIDADATSAATGGGGAVIYTANQLVSGSPSRWTVWDEKVKFDTAFDVQATLKQLYYRSPKPLATANQSNWLTARYPLLMRKACQAAVADFMKDDGEYQKNVTALNNLIGTIAANDDLIYRGAEFGTDTP